MLWRLQSAITFLQSMMANHKVLQPSGINTISRAMGRCRLHCANSGLLKELFPWSYTWQTAGLHCPCLVYIFWILLQSPSASLWQLWPSSKQVIQGKDNESWQDGNSSDQTNSRWEGDISSLTLETRPQALLIVCPLATESVISGEDAGI